MSSVQLKYRIKNELFTWSSLALVMALLEGGVIGVLLKNAFNGKVDDWILNISVAIATGAPYFSNLISFIWIKLSHGRHKAVIVSNLAILCCLCAIAISFVPFNTFGLITLLILLVISRIGWSGVLTIRSTIWRANYPRHIRGKVAAKLATLAALLMSLTALFSGWILDWKFAAFQWLYIGFALFAFLGAYRYRFLSVRHHHKTLHREKSKSHDLSFTQMFALLKNNNAFGKYMLSMFILGSGNLMFMAPLIVYINEHTDLTKMSQILITTAIPLGLMPLVVRWWAKLLDGNHVFHFRAIHSWIFVAALALFAVAAITKVESLFFVGSATYGFAVAGGFIGWNLGHNDFVGKDNPIGYMAVHVTLTGIRGLFAPLLGILFYQWLESNQPGSGKFALLLPLSMTTLGGILFVYFNRQRVNIAKKHDLDNKA